MAAGDLPNFRRLYDSSVVRTTDCGEAAPFLEPWIQWPTVHFGVSRHEHGAFSLGDGRNYAGDGLATILSGAGVRVGVFGSMNTNYERLNGYYIPDPWVARGRAHPEELVSFSQFVARQVQESSRPSGGIGVRDALRFLLFLARNGLTGRTIVSIVRQLLAERREPNLRWKRAMLQDAISYDVFEALNAKYDVAYASFFSNSVAHFQHYHWRDMEPGIFDHPLEADADASHRDAIREGYIRNDALVGRVLRSYPESTILFVTALSQQPWIETAKCVYRPHDFATLLAFAGIADVRVEPVMAEEFRIVGGSSARIEAALRALHCDGVPLMKTNVIEGAVHAGCAIEDGSAGILETIVTGPAGTKRFGDLFYRLSAMRSGRHHPAGAFWMRDGSPHRVEREPVALETIAPTILRMFGIETEVAHAAKKQPSFDVNPVEGEVLAALHAD